MHRRRLLRATAAAAVPAALAGCPLGGSPSTPTPSDGADDGAGPRTPTATPAGFDHPAARAVGDQPWLGPPPGTAEGTIVAFEDPSCPTCRRFERRTFPEVKTRLTDAGRATFVFRGVPVVYPWGEPATRILEAVHDRAPGAFWSLKAHYYETQREFTTDTVAERSRSFLAANADVDAEAVASAALDGEYDDAVATDLSAGRAAGARHADVLPVLRDRLPDRRRRSPELRRVRRRAGVVGAAGGLARRRRSERPPADPHPEGLSARGRNPGPWTQTRPRAPRSPRRRPARGPPSPRSRSGPTSPSRRRPATPTS